MANVTPIKAFSAPGKAMIAGGYLVLDPQYKSYVVALSSRMHSVIEIAAEGGEPTVTVNSPQFANDTWTFNKEYVELNGKKNPFVKSTVSTVLEYYKSHGKTLDRAVTITIFSDPGYHSQENTVIRDQKKFHYHKDTITKIPKTGLGSSAGLVTVLTTALVSYFKDDLDVSSQNDLTLIHNLAQTAHCEAQGKVGSGFDVAAAVYGSIEYQRFTSLMHPDSEWDMKVKRITLPKGLRLIMGDVNSGSETTKLVAKVSAWRKQDPKAAEVYSAIDKNNNLFIDSLSHPLNAGCLEYVAAHSSKEILDIGKYPHVAAMIEAVSAIRENFRYITQHSGAEIEPECQTLLLDACQTLPGVICGVVPGAGGYDAICLLTVEDLDIASITKSDERFSNVTWLNLHQQDLGIIQEDPLHYTL